MVDLPAPLGPSRAKTSPVLDLEVETVDGVEVAVVLVEVGDLNGVRAHDRETYLELPRAATPPGG